MSRSSTHPHCAEPSKPYRDALATHRAAINRLNVYPVPDGDTGTNMALTLESVVGELAGAGPDMAAVCQAIAHGSLMGARGNSGVILSQILRGLAECAETRRRRRPGAGRRRWSRRPTAAYGAVLRPVEGTILTVVARRADAAGGARRPADRRSPCVEAAAAGAAQSRWRALPTCCRCCATPAWSTPAARVPAAASTPLLHVVDGRRVPAPIDEPGADPSRPADLSASADGVADLRYEVMYLLELADASIAGVQGRRGIASATRSWSSGGKGLCNCHIHTNDIGAAIEAALEAGGRPRRIRVTDLLEEVEEQHWVREARRRRDHPTARAVATAVVAVGVGRGYRRICSLAGRAARSCPVVRSMNPSTADLLDAVERVPAA